MDLEYRVVSSLIKGYFVLYPTKEGAVSRAEGCVIVGSKDAMAGLVKVQSRPKGTVGDDSTWKDEQWES